MARIKLKYVNGFSNAGVSVHLALAGHLTKLATTRSRFMRAVRNAVFVMINHIKPAKLRMLNLSGLGQDDLARLPAPASDERAGRRRTSTANAATALR
jgi:hypothetical protein